MTTSDGAISTGGIDHLQPVNLRLDNLTRVKCIVSASSGNLVEWYDFYIYAFTSIYFAHHFSPADNPATQLLTTAGIFAVGFFMRPLGGWLFGWIADAHGRKISMIISVLMMCGGSLMIAILPTYESIGISATVLLLLARLLQGLSVGGEYGTAATYMSEIATKGKRGFYASFQYVTLVGGQLTALAVLIVVQYFLSNEELRSWGWRIPFFIGALLAVVSSYLRRTLEETADTGEARHKEAGSLRGLLSHKKAVIITFGLTMGSSLYFYTFTTYMQKHLVNVAKFSPKDVSLLMTAALIIFCFAQPLFGMLADRIGRRTNLVCFTALGMLATVPLYGALGQATTTTSAFVLVLASLLIALFYTSISGVAKADLFPPEVRALGVGFPYAVANAVFGGTAEFLALYANSNGYGMTYAWYVVVIMGMALLCTLWMPQVEKHGYLEGDGRI